jgi:23S rRNA (adenine2030-N6)-methyltransferase
MNYRHLYHAGNFGDVFKHAVLLLMLRRMLAKDGPVTVLDTHAGRGLYDLQSTEAQKTNEATLGILRAQYSDNMLLGDYLRVVGEFNPKGSDSIRYYPGSPAFIAHTLRKADLLILNELHNEEASELRAVFKGDKQVNIHQRDAYEIWPALTPPKTKRGLYLIDPPFEKPEEFSTMRDALVESYKKCSLAVIMMWYPLKDRPSIWRWHESLVTTGIKKMMMVEHCLYTEERADRFNGSGFVIINPPYSFQQELPPLLEAIRTALTIDGQKSTMKVDWLAA